MKPDSDLTPADFRQHPVWEYCNDQEADTGDETLVRPVRDVPVDDLGNRLVGTTLRFANGDLVDGFLGSLELNNLTKTEHFIAQTLYRSADGTAFHLARYHDIDSETRGPTACAAYFGLGVADMFPIVYDIESFAIGLPAVLQGTIPAKPARRLDDDELIRMAVFD